MRKITGVNLLRRTERLGKLLCRKRLSLVRPGTLLSLRRAVHHGR